MNPTLPDNNDGDISIETSCAGSAPLGMKNDSLDKFAHFAVDMSCG